MIRYIKKENTKAGMIYDKKEMRYIRDAEVVGILNDKEEIIIEAYGHGTDINNNENGWREFVDVSVKPMGKYDLLTSGGSLRRGVHGNRVIDIMNGVGMKIVMYRELV